MASICLHWLFSSSFYFPPLFTSLEHRVHKLTITLMHLSVQCQVNRLVLKAFPFCKIDCQLLILHRFLLNSTRYHRWGTRVLLTRLINLFFPHTSQPRPGSIYQPSPQPYSAPSTVNQPSTTAPAPVVGKDTQVGS